MVKVLHITSNLDGGGIDRIIYNYAVALTGKGIHFDFAVSSNKIGMLEDKLKELGYSVYHIPRIKKNYFRRKRCLTKIMRDNSYDVVHDHSSYKAFFSLKIAKKCGIKKRIAHAHSAIVNLGLIQTLIKKVLTVLTCKSATELFACGEYAKQWAWGNRKATIIPNAIFMRDYCFSEVIRDSYRKLLNINNRYVLAIVARLSPEKNYPFLINVFKKVFDANNNSVLVIVGAGELESEIKMRVDYLGITNNVLFLGLRDDVKELLNAFDVFLLPSKYEGVPVTIVEAQANGLPCLISDNVTKEVSFNDNIFYLPIDDEDIWADKIIGMSNLKRDSSRIVNSSYNIETASLILKKKYYE